MELLIELGCEELPAGGLGDLARHLADGFSAGLKKRGIATEQCTALWTPRRLVVRISDLPAAQAEQQLERRGPALSAGLDAAGQPSKALLGFAASCGVSVEQLQKLETDKGSWFVHRATQAGRATIEVIPEVFAEALAALPIAKPMRWGANDYAFLRPVHWLLALLDDQIVPMQAFGQSSGRITYGHRFHAPEAISLAHPGEFEAALERAFVKVNPAQRAQIVHRQVQALAAEIQGRAEIPAGLLDEVKQLAPFKNLNALQTVGYRELFEYLEGTISLDFAIDEIKKNTRRFAKRQMTWFKRTENAIWFDYLTDRKDIISNINDNINGNQKS